jgi:toxin ParE1/3/4
MIYKLVVSKEADEDIEDIVLYIVSELNNPSAASAFLDDVEKSYNNIVEKPAMYSLCNDYRLRNGGYRKIVIKNYLILYRINEDDKMVIVVRVVYGGRNYSELI